VRLLVSAGARVSHQVTPDQSAVSCDPSIERVSTLYLGLKNRRAHLLSFLINECDALKDWQSRYAGKAEYHITLEFAELLREAPYADTTDEGKGAMEMVKMMLDGGWTCVHSRMLEPGAPLINSALVRLFFKTPKKIDEPDLSDAQVIRMLQLLQSYHVDLARADTNILFDGAHLIHYAALRESERLLDWVLENIPGADINAVCMLQATGMERALKVTPLGIVLREKNVKMAEYLLRKGAKAVIEGLSYEWQPCRYLFGYTYMDDRSAAPLLKQMLALQPDLCDPRYHTPEPDGTVQNPFSMAVLQSNSKGTQCLELLLDAGDAEARRRAVQQICILDGGEDGEMRASVAEWAAVEKNYAALALLLKHTDLPVTDEKRKVYFGEAMGPAHEDGLLPSVEEVVLGRHVRDRAVIALVKMRAKTERSELAAAGKKGTSSTSAAEKPPSNAPEDAAVKVLSEKEEKAKAKKRAQKKKAKERKRAAAAAASAAATAGAGAEAPPEDSDSSGSDSEEEGMDEEERMLARAPTFDLEKERAARKAAKEKEEKEGQAGKE
jgi:hypothetical protein